MSQPPTPPHPPAGGSKRNRAKWIVGGIAILGCLAVAVVVGVTLLWDPAPRVTGHPSTNDVSGQLDDWVAAVCEPGTLRDGTEIVRSSNATAGSICHARIKPAGGNDDSILIVRFDSEAHMMNDLDKSRIQFYAFAIRNGEWIAFTPVGRDGDERLAPLEQFGFEIVRS